MKLVGIMKLIISIKWQKKEEIEDINQDKTVDDEIPNRSRSKRIALKNDQAKNRLQLCNEDN